REVCRRKSRVEPGHPGTATTQATDSKRTTNAPSLLLSCDEVLTHYSEASLNFLQRAALRTHHEQRESLRQDRSGAPTGRSSPGTRGRQVDSAGILVHCQGASAGLSRQCLQGLVAIGRNLPQHTERAFLVRSEDPLRLRIEHRPIRV